MSMTIKEKWRRIQGIVGAQVDGIPGDETATRILTVIDTTTQTANTTPTQTADMVSEHFSRAELACRCCGKLEDMTGICAKAELIRDHFGGKPLFVTSGTRCPAHNAEVGGVANSRHVSGRAIDGTIDGVSADEVVNYAYGIGCRYAYHIANSNCFHIDI